MIGPMYFDREGNPVPNDEGYRLLEEDRQVADWRTGDIRVSTVHLVLDHGWGGGRPVIFETLVFGGPLDQEMDRYCTEHEARLGHLDMVDRVKAALALEKEISMDEPTEAWEQPPAPPVAVPEGLDLMISNCSCSGCTEIRRRIELAALSQIVGGTVPSAGVGLVAEIARLKKEVEEQRQRITHYKNVLAEANRWGAPPALPAVVSQSNGKYTRTQYGDAELWDLFEEEQKQELAEIRNMKQSLKEIRVTPVKRPMRATFYEWAELLWLPGFVLLIILSYLLG